ncbi:MAG: cytochrome c, partial [bacterium]
MTRKYVAVLAVLISLGLFASTLSAQEDSAYVEYRQALMKSLGTQMGSIGAILKNRLPMKENIASHASIIAIDSELLPSGFEKETMAGKTEASPAVWQQWEQFKAAAMATGKESQKLAEVATSGSVGDIAGQMKNLG